MKYLPTFCLIVLFAAVSIAADHTKDSLATVKQNIENKKAVLVDVREKSEWDEGHVKGAIFLPLSGLRDGITPDKLKPLPKGKIIYLHCVVGQRAKVAGSLLEKYNYKVRPLKPGYDEIISAGFPKADK